MGSESFEFVERAYGWQRPRSPSPEGGPPPIQMQMQVDLLGAGTAGAGASPGAAVQRSAEPTASVEAAGASADAEASSATSAATQVELLPANLVFGVVEVGTTAPLGNVQVWNRGAEIVTIQGCVVSGAGFVAELWHVPHLAQIAAPVQLAPGQKIWMSVEFHPVTAGEHVALVSVLMPDGAGATLLAKGSGEQSSLQGSARGGAPRDAGAQPQPAPADTPPVAKAVEPVEHRLEARPKSLDLTTVAGRATLPQPIRLTNPNTVYVSADLSIETDDDHDQVFSITGNGNYRRDAASLHTYVAPREHNLPEEIPITFTPGALGSYQAALHVRYAQFEERVPLSGTALPGRGADSATKESGNAGTSSPDEFAIRTASTPLLEAEKPKSNADARALLLQAADAVSALAPAYQAQVPQMKAVADLFIDECAAAAGAFNKELVHWITTECATALGGMNSNNFKDFLDFLMGRAISLLPKPLDVILGIVYDVVSLGVDIWQVSAQNRVVNTALAQNTYLGGMLAGATSDTTQHVIRVLGRGLESFGEALGALDETAGPGASDQLKDIGKRLEGLDGATALSEAVDCYEAARKFVDRHQENMHQLARALGDLSRAHIMLTSNLPKQLGKLMDRYIEFMSTGGKPHDKPIAISIGGVINYEGSYDRRRSFILYFGSIRFGDASLTGKTESYVGRKRMLDLAGYDVTIVLVSPQGGEVVLRQAADRSRSDEVPSDAERRIEGAGGVAALWASIDEKQLHELLRRSR